MDFPAQGVRLIHYWNEQNGQCLGKDLHANNKYYYLFLTTQICKEGNRHK